MTTTAVPRALLRRAAFASLVGTAVEWYDYFIFGSASALVFGKLFFPETSPVVGTLSSFAVFGVGFFARPLGGIVFGHIGDRLGRKGALVATLLIMGVSTFAIGLLPTAATIGVAAPALLVLLRLLQGFGVGGEWGGAALVAVEYAPDGRRGRYGSFPQVGNALGVVLSTGVFGLVSRLPDAAFESWGWRLPFLLSAVLVIVGFVLRTRLTETPAFRAAQERAELSRNPLGDTVRDNKKPLILAMCMRFSEGVLGYVILTFILSYATERVDVDKNVVLGATTAAAVVGMATAYLAGAASDRFGRRPVYLFGAALSALFAFPFFWLVDTGSTVAIFFAVVFGYAVALEAQYGVEPSFFSELFGTAVRYSGISMGYQLSAIVAGGMVPFVATALTTAAGGRSWPVSLYIIVASIVTLVAVLLARETHRVDLIGRPAGKPGMAASKE